ncbi:MAG TPA: TfpX/TfpZ family type IV pilin accessory protein [Albitalea sp.]|nr:TfpX/TfpZ family type IV pilin accessory protein [Albitalea sp.]
MKLNRFQAFAAHLLGSALVALTSAALVFLLWYPAPLAMATGVTDIFLILLAVDVVVGPCITLIIFRPDKKPLKELRRDLSIVLVLQLAALSYGLHTVFIARPVYAVYNAGRFDLVYANDLDEHKLKQARHPEFQSLPLLGPKIIAARSPTDAKQRRDILMGSLSGGDDLPQMPQHYVPYADEQPNAVKRIQPIDALRSLNKDAAGPLDELVRKYAARKGGIGYLPLRAKVKDVSVIVALDTAEVLEIAPLNPWP